ncbi:hypothetical protein RHMOL_Rhmol13G0032200 [Rhododendron molle]|uniref:Uncharacterized protein n=1 Tax=Rhododendron molle TaxID=49168 RepID=A0ACC0L3J5_RHOML|nr:hypothetical protein RHMOL_Rhmol13G0032200 [Rhododendron molle]
MSCISSSPSFSPSSDKRFWRALHSRIDTLLENRKPIPTQPSSGEIDGAKSMREDSLLLLRGFDSVGYSLSQLSQNLDNALQGARDLARPPTMTEIYQSAMERAKSKQEEENEEGKRGLKRKPEAQTSSDEEFDSQKENEKSPKEEGKLKKAKNLAISMAAKATSLARELKSIKLDLCFMQERCALLEEENTRLRDGFSEGIRPEEDDLVRLQLEALLAEKSRLANENANLTRENQCLHQIVEYHQLTSQDLSESYSEDVIRGLCLDFSSPPPPIPEEENRDGNEHEDGNQVTKTPQTDRFGWRTSLDEFYDQEQQNEEDC